MLATAAAPATASLALPLLSTLLGGILASATAAAAMLLMRSPTPASSCKSVKHCVVSV